jgi:hypothetical protein
VAFGFSAQLLMTGILGEYVGRIYEEIKRRPLYVVAQEINFSAEANRAERTVVAPSTPPDAGRPAIGQRDALERPR